MSFRHGNSSAGAAAATGTDAFSDAKTAAVAGTGTMAVRNRNCTAGAAAAADTLIQAARHGGGHHRAYKRHTEKNRDHLFHFLFPPSVFAATAQLTSGRTSILSSVWLSASG